MNLLKGRMSNDLIKTIDAVKLKHRTSKVEFESEFYPLGIKLDDWCSGNYYLRPEVTDKVLKGQDPDFRDTIERVHVNDFTVEEFLEKYEKGSRPVIIQGVTHNWLAKERWTIKVSRTHHL